MDSLPETTLLGNFRISGESRRLSLPVQQHGIWGAFASFLGRLELDDNEIRHWRSAFFEATTNALIHPRREDGSPPGVQVRWECTGEEVVLTVADRGSGPPLEGGNPRLPDSPFQSHGRGLFLVHHACHRVEHWVSSSGHRMEMARRYPQGLVDPFVEDDLDSVLEELRIGWECLNACYRFAGGLLSQSSVALYVAETVDWLGRIVECDRIRIYPSGSDSPVERCLGHRPEYGDAAALPPALARSMDAGEERSWRNEAPFSLPEEARSCGIQLPLVVEQRTLGALLLVRPADRPFASAGEQKLVRTAADLVALALALAENEALRRRQERLDEELRIAGDIQDRLLPAQGLPADSGLRTFVRRISARRVGGDMGEVFRTGDGRIYLLVADVMGKGVPAALYGAIFRSALMRALERVSPLAEVMRELDTVLTGTQWESLRFVTCGLVRIDPEDWSWEAVNAGHCPILMLKDGAIAGEIAATDPPLGASAAREGRVHRGRLERGGGFLAVTDGFFEFPYGEGRWGWDRFIRFLTPTRLADSPKLWQDWSILCEAESPGHELADDATLLTILR